MKKTMKNLAISIDIGASRIRIALITKTGMIIKKLESPMPQKAKRGKEVTEKIIVLIKELSNNFKSDSFLGIGISIYKKDWIIIMLGLLFFSHVLLHVLVHYIDRYRPTILPVLVIISGYFLGQLWLLFIKTKIYSRHFNRAVMDSNI